MILQNLKVMDLRSVWMEKIAFFVFSMSALVSKIPLTTFYGVDLFYNRTKFEDSLDQYLIFLDNCCSPFHKVLKAPKGCVVKYVTFLINFFFY